MQINKVAVIGSGVMGAAIAAHVANSGTQVVLLDIVPKDASDDRSKLAKGAIERMKKADPAPFTHPRKAKLVTAGNLEDDLELLSDADWIIEAVLEDIDIKRNLYKTINGVRRPKSVVSSNTSTIPLEDLVDGMPDEFVKHFMITHFFNPPRYMRLLELVVGKHTDSGAANVIRDFCDIRLGKGVVDCHDSPGFIANRIGCFWMTVAVLDAIEQGVDVETADSLLSRPIGVPKTGVFGLLDLIGIDLMPLIAKSFSGTLPKDDWFLKIYEQPQIISDMIADGYTGRKGKGGFYRLNTDGGKKQKEVKDLSSGEYAAAQRPKVDAAGAAKSGWRGMLEYDDKAGKYARSVMLKTLSYTASLVPTIADDIYAVDEAMKLGYNWKYGPFELIDRLKNADQHGSTWLINALKEDGMEVPDLLEAAKDKDFYQIDDTKKQYLTTNGSYGIIPSSDDVWMLADKKLGKKPLLKNASASVWDIGDGIVCVEYTTKMNSVDPFVLEMLAKATDFVQEKGYKGMVVANDGDNFCVGANIGILLFAANVAAWSQINDIIKQGQDTFMGLKYAPFPVVLAPAGMSLGGGCEILLHADAVQAHVETYTGLVEVGVGIVPGWGGCKEMILRHLESDTIKRLSLAEKGGMFALSMKQAFSGGGSASLRHPIATINAMPAISKSFEYIATAKVAKSAEEARDMLILRDSDGITMNRKRLLPDAKARCLELAKNYVVPEKPEVRLPGATAKTALEMAIAGFVKSGKATPHDEVVSKAVAHVLSGGDTDITCVLTEQDMLDLELEMFMHMVKQLPTLDRIEHMLNTGKPLRN